MCMQEPGHAMFFGDPGMSEDCLTINIVRPNGIQDCRSDKSKRDNEGVPVLVWM